MKDILGNLFEITLFDIDQNQLDVEWLKQPKLFFEYAAMLADARAEYEKEKADREVVKARLDLDIRSNPEDYDLDKVTEGAITNVLATQESVITGNEAVLAAKHKLDRLQAAVEALDQRKKALENLVGLFGMNYFAEPRAPKGAKEYIADEVKKNVRKKGQVEA